MRSFLPTPSYFRSTTYSVDMPTARAWLRMIAPIGEEFSPPTHPVRNPNRDSAYETLYSPPPTHTSSIGANSIRPCCGGERRSMHSPRLTRSYRHSLASRIFTLPTSAKGGLDGES